MWLLIGYCQKLLNHSDRKRGFYSFPYNIAASVWVIAPFPITALACLNHQTGPGPQTLDYHAVPLADLPEFIGNAGVLSDPSPEDACPMES